MAAKFKPDNYTYFLTCTYIDNFKKVAKWQDSEICSVIWWEIYLSILSFDEYMMWTDVQIFRFQLLLFVWFWKFCWHFFWTYWYELNKTLHSRREYNFFRLSWYSIIVSFLFQLFTFCHFRLFQFSAVFCQIMSNCVVELFGFLSYFKFVLW